MPNKKKKNTITQIYYKNKNYALKKFGMRTKENLTSVLKPNKAKKKKVRTKIIQILK